MARAVLFAQSYRGYNDDRRSISIDEFVDIDMMVSIDPIRTEGSGTLTFNAPSYAIWARPPSSFLDPHGHLVKTADIEWLEKTPRNIGEKFICRVNQLNVTDTETGKAGFLVEVISGLDARQLTRANDFEQVTNWAKEHWWQIALIVVGIWWLFF